MAEKDEEKWEPVTVGDQIFNVPRGGDIAYYGNRGNDNFGSIVRQRDGKWMKRVKPLEIMYPNNMLMKIGFVTGEKFLADKTV